MLFLNQNSISCSIPYSNSNYDNYLPYNKNEFQHTIIIPQYLYSFNQ